MLERNEYTDACEGRDEKKSIERRKPQRDIREVGKAERCVKKIAEKRLGCGGGK